MTACTSQPSAAAANHCCLDPIERRHRSLPRASIASFGIPNTKLVASSRARL
jgi:hypothetical protein